MSAILSALLGTSQTSQTSEPVMDTPVIATSASDAPVAEPAAPTSDAPVSEPAAPTSDASVSSADVPAAEPAADQPAAGQPVSEPKKPKFSGSFVIMGPDGKITREEKNFETFDEFEKFLSTVIGQITSAAQPADDGNRDFPAGLPPGLSRLLEVSRRNCPCKNCGSWREKNGVAQPKVNSSTSAAPVAEPSKPESADTNADKPDDTEDEAAEDFKNDPLNQLMELLMGKSRRSRVDPSNPATFSRLPAVGDSKPRETFIPLLHRDVSLCTPTPPNGMSTEFYARQYCDISTDASAATLDLSSWVNSDLLKSLIQTASQKTTTTPEARVHVLPGTYVRNRTTRQNVVASVFMRRLQTWLGEQFGQDATWKRVVVFDADLLGYTVCY